MTLAVVIGHGGVEPQELVKKSGGLEKASAHCEQVHQAVVETGKLDLVHVQADEIRVKGRNMIAWMGLAMMVSTRLWLAGSVSVSRDKGLAACRRDQSSSPTNRTPRAYILHGTGRSVLLLFRRRQNRGRDGGSGAWKKASTRALRPG